MGLLTATEIRDFTLRSNYMNRHTLLLAKGLHSCGTKCTGYSAPMVDFQLQSGEMGNIAIRDIDVPLVCDDNRDKAKHHLALILNVARGDREAAAGLALAEQQHPWVADSSPVPEPAETRFVVPSTSCEPHSEQEISQKAYILLKLIQLGYPVPDFVVLTTDVYGDGHPNIEQHLGDAVAQLELLTMKRLGDRRDPLVFAVRCAMAQYIPGVMDTFLNVGVTETTLPSLAGKYGPVVAHRMYLNNLRNLCSSLDREDAAALAGSVGPDTSLEELGSLIDQLSFIVRKADPRLVEDAFYQAGFFVKQAYKHFEEDHDLLATLCRGPGHYPSVILQKMVCTVRHDNAYAGVISSRNTQTGVGIELQIARNIFGEEMMTGTVEVESTNFQDPQEIYSAFPAVYHFAPHLADLEREFESPVTIEFAVEATKRHQSFALLQLNETGMAGRAAMISVVDLHKSGAISRRRVTELIRPYHIKQLTSDTIDPESFHTLNTFCSGVAVLPRSAVSVRVYFSGDAALIAKSRGEMVCLCKKTFVPTDTVVMREMDAILSLTSAAIHVVTICQNLGIPALLSLEKHGVTLQPGGPLVNGAGREIKQGDWITISSRRHTIYEGKAAFRPARLLRYMRGEPVQLDAEDKRTFDSIAYAYRYYQQLVRGMKVEQITLNEVTRLVNFELRSESEQARQFVNAWFDKHESVYTEEVFKSDIGDHLCQANVFDMLTLDRKIRFFKRALAKCADERLCGYEAGAFMLGRFLAQSYPVAFWRCFTPLEIGLLVNEWILFEKYMQLLHTVGEKKVLHARKKILKEGLDQLPLHPGYVQRLMTLKLSGVRLEEVHQSLPDWSDPQSVKVLELLQQPYGVFYDFRAPWSVGELEKLCHEEHLAVPSAEET